MPNRRPPYVSCDVLLEGAHRAPYHQNDCDILRDAIGRFAVPIFVDQSICPEATDDGNVRVLKYCTRAGGGLRDVCIAVARPPETFLADPEQDAHIWAHGRTAFLFTLTAQVPAGRPIARVHDVLPV